MPASFAAARLPRHVRWWRALKAALGAAPEPPYVEAIDAIDAAVVLFDAQDRLVLCSRSFRALYPGLSHLLVPGRSFEALLREAAVLGMIPEAQGDLEGFIVQRLRQHRELGSPLLRQMADGRWRRITEQRLADGSLLSFSIDVSELVEKERALDAARAQAQQERERLQDAIEALPDGFALYDEQDRLVAFNEHYRQIYQLSAPAIRPGTRFEDILRYGLARGQYPAAEGQAAAWLEERLYRHRHADQPILQELPGNRWMRIEERKTRLGGVAGVRVDVTELVQREQQLKQLNARLAESRAQLHAVIGTAHSAIVTLDEHGVVLSANPATATIFGWPEAELIGHDIRVLEPSMPGADPPALIDARAAAARAGRA
ncbi:MAG: PAS-domain containing protein, partial [Proteobacteria bacterium]|nr:PAS-domain containing protein [Pseudomonadota bacterium]